MRAEIGNSFNQVRLQLLSAHMWVRFGTDQLSQFTVPTGRFESWDRV